MTDHPRFGVWANVHGTMAALGHPDDPVDASWPRIYLGGESEPARDLAAREADVLFLNGQSPQDAQALIADVRRRTRGGLDPLRFGLAAFVVTAPTEHEAAELMEYHWHLNAKDKAGEGDTIDRFTRDTDPASVMWQRLRERPHIGPNGGTAAGLVGDYDSVAQRIVDWYDGGIETFMLAFQPFESEMRRFSEEVMPRVRRTAGQSGDRVMTGPLRFHWYLPTHGDTTTIADNRGSTATRAASHLEPTLQNLSALGRTAEDFGFEAVLTPTGSHCEDSWIATAALAQHTRRLKFLVAFRPGVLSPTLAAQQVSTYQRFTGIGWRSTWSPAAMTTRCGATATVSTRPHGIGAPGSFSVS